ncbi:GNAT family N-acetyltransferase [Thermococcus argininiproducens]|uniref:GNAT family N-acetyltransferase n=1 Tax=Thermococcus argininiproducens TaxID=2866384 RepID=A0A9E7M9B6_9EURY|nr:GNAT family N-acetyltransferase [Thermococcus argininiproducens]USG99327.1 GNAT family N-acetyltransferase [Thermococcus argininiproducens]
MNIRIAKLEDVKGIVEVHCSDIERWIKKDDNREATYEELSIKDRYLHGGPWMSIETCAVHLNNLLLEGQIPIVVETNGKIIGNAEVLISEELINGKMYRIAHLDILEVHKDFRRKGIGREIVNFVEDLAKEKGCDLLTVVPEKSAIGFYAKLGIDNVIYQGYFAEFETSLFSDVNASINLCEFSWEDIKDREMVSGKFQSSYHHWFEAFRNRIAGIDDARYFESGKLRNSYYILEEAVYNNKIVTAYMWGREEDFPLLLNRAKNLGFTKLRTIVEENLIKEFNPKILDKMIILSKHL